MNPRRFKRFTPNKRAKHNTPDTLSWSRLPIYILPDVLLNAHMTETYAEKIYETIQKNGKGPANIFTYNTSGVETDTLASWDLATHVGHLVNDILLEHNNSPLPVILAGYSSGTTLATEIALELQKRGIQSKVFELDGAARSMLRSFADSKPDSDSFVEFKKELVALVQYAARFSGYYTNKTSKSGLSEETLASLTPQESLIVLGINPDEVDISGMMRTDRTTSFFNNIIDQVKRLQSDNMLENMLLKKFESLLTIGKRMVINEVSAEPKDRQKLPQVYTIFTHETAKKYGVTTEDGFNSFTGGWENNAHKVISLNSYQDTLAFAKHSTLLNSDNATLIAELMYKTLNEDPELTPEQLHLQQTKASLNLVRNNPEINREVILDGDLKNLAALVGEAKLQAAVMRLFKPYRVQPQELRQEQEDEITPEASPLGTSPVDETVYPNRILTPTMQIVK